MAIFLNEERISDNFIRLAGDLGEKKLQDGQKDPRLTATEAFVLQKIAVLQEENNVLKTKLNKLAKEMDKY